MFLGLTNSADDIIRDRVVLQRERNLNVRLPLLHLLESRHARALRRDPVRALRAHRQRHLGNPRHVLDLRVFQCSSPPSPASSLGLLISSLVADAKTAANIVPLVLIPQIILGGALIKYEEMNRNLDFIYTIQRWFKTHPGSDVEKNESRLQVPLLCEFMPMRWSYEAIVVAQAKLNPLTRRQDRLQDEINDLVAINERTPAQADRLEDVKDTLALVSALEATDATDVDRRLRKVDRVLAGAALDTVSLKSKRGVSAERLYVNQKISDLVSKAETEQADYRRLKRINVFFGPEKSLGSMHFSVLIFNTIVLISFSLGTLGFLHISLRRQLSTKG